MSCYRGRAVAKVGRTCSPTPSYLLCTETIMFNLEDFRGTPVASVICLTSLSGQPCSPAESGPP